MAEPRSPQEREQAAASQLSQWRRAEFGITEAFLAALKCLGAVSSGPGTGARRGAYCQVLTAARLRGSLSAAPRAALPRAAAPLGAAGAPPRP